MKLVLLKYTAIEKSDEAIHELYFKKYLELLDYNKDNFNKFWKGAY